MDILLYMYTSKLWCGSVFWQNLIMLQEITSNKVSGCQTTELLVCVLTNLAANL